MVNSEKINTIKDEALKIHDPVMCVSCSLQHRLERALFPQVAFHQPDIEECSSPRLFTSSFCGAHSVQHGEHYTASGRNVCPNNLLTSRHASYLF